MKVRASGCVGTGTGLMAALLVGLLAGAGFLAEGAPSLTTDPPPSWAPSVIRDVAFLSVSLAASPSVIEPGTPVDVQASVTGGTPPYVVDWTDSSGGTGVGSSWSATMGSAGNLSIVCRVTDAQGGLAGSTATVPVLPPPELSFVGPAVLSYGLQSVSGNLSIAGGEPPYELSYGLLGDAPVYSGSLPTSGGFPFEIPVPALGSIEIAASVVDALGGDANATAYEGTTGGPLVLAPPVAPSQADAGTVVPLTAVVSGGSSPVRWSVSASRAVVAPEGMGGILSSPGLLEWPAEFAEGGNVTVLFEVQDAAGRSSSASVELTILDPLVVVAGTPLPSAALGPSVRTFVTVAGGAPPYELLWAASDGESGVANLTSSGTALVSVQPAAEGNLTLNGTVADAAGGVQAWGVRVAILGSPAGSGTSNGAGAGAPAVLLAVAGLGAAAGALGATFWRRRPKPPAPPSTGSTPPADDRVERLVSENEGIEPEAVLLMAEEQGIPRAEARSALDRAKRSGRIRSETGAEGEELLQWAGRSEPADPEEQP